MNLHHLIKLALTDYNGQDIEKLLNEIGLSKISIYDVKELINNSNEREITATAIAICLCNDTLSLIELARNLCKLTDIGAKFDIKKAWRLCKKRVNNKTGETKDEKNN